MNTRHFVWIGVLVGSTIGSWIPAIWDAGNFSISGVIFGMIGGFVGIYIGVKIANW